MNNKERSWTDIIILVLLQAVLWMEAGGFLSTVVLKVAKWGSLFTGDVAIAEDIGTYMSSIGFCISIVLALIIFRKNRKLLKPLCPAKKITILTGSAIGLAAGTALNGALVMGAMATGSLKLTLGSIDVPVIIGYLVAILLQAGGEELICRLFIMGKLRRRYKSPIVAIVGNSLFFTVFHLGNPGINAASILNLVAVSILFSLVVFYSGNIWTAIMLHAAWNFTQTIIFGLPNSGMSSPYSIFKVVSSSNGLCYDTGFGVEGSWAAFILISLAAIALILISRKRGAADVI